MEYITKKLDEGFFQMKQEGRKNWELRIEDDHKFLAGEVIQYREWDPLNRVLTGRQLLVEVIEVIRLPGIEKNHCLMIDRLVTSNNTWLESYASAMRKFPLEQIYRELNHMATKIAATPSNAGLYDFLEIILLELRSRSKILGGKNYDSQKY